MKILVTGIAGFVGNFLCHELTEAGHSVVGIDLNLNNSPKNMSDGISIDVTDAEKVSTAIANFQPDACIHLGGIASPPVGRKHPELMLSVNTLGTLNILEALRHNAPQARMLLASTSYIYGNPETDKQIDEHSPISPTGIYAVSKAAADTATLAYAREYGMHTMTARPANHTGPGQSTAFVVPAFAAQIKSIAAGVQDPLMYVGNLESERTFLDVRDVVHAYRLLIENGTPGLAYNIATQRRIPIKHVLDKLCELAGASPEIKIDNQLFRPTDKSPILSTKRINAAVGWTPKIPLEQTLRDILNS